MKKKVINIISIVLVSVIIIPSTLFLVFGTDGISEPMELTKIDYQYRTTSTSSTLSSSIYYSDYMLLEDANVFSADMAKASVATAVAAYSTDEQNPSCDPYTGFINYMLSRMGYKSTNYNDKLDLSIDDNDHVAYTVGVKEVKYNCETYILYCIPVRGTPQNAEWYSNFNLGTGSNHEGFYNAANEVLDNLYDTKH